MYCFLQFPTTSLDELETTLRQMLVSQCSIEITRIMDESIRNIKADLLSYYVELRLDIIAIKQSLSLLVRHERAANQ